MKIKYTYAGLTTGLALSCLSTPLAGLAGFLIVNIVYTPLFILLGFVIDLMIKEFRKS